MEEVITVTINDWKYHRGRNDISRPTWFRLEHKLFDDKTFDDYTHEEFKVWVYLLTLACKNQDAVVRVDINEAKKKGNFTSHSIHQAINKLEKSALLSKAPLVAQDRCYMEGPE